MVVLAESYFEQFQEVLMVQVCRCIQGVVSVVELHPLAQMDMV